MIALDKLFGRRSGIIHELIQSDVPASEPRLYTFAAMRGNLSWETGLEIASGSGCKETKIEALAACCGEVAERYCCSFIPRPLLTGSFTALQQEYPNLVSPLRFQFFSAAQFSQPHFPFCQITEFTPLEWVAAEELTRGGTCYIPAFAVYLPYSCNDTSGYYPATSTGLACGASYDEALTAAILEIIERDAFTNFWVNQLSPTSLRIPDREPYRQLKKKFRMQEIEYVVLDLTSDFGVPVVAAFSFGQSSFGYVASLGLGCHFSGYIALKKALLENAQGRLSVYACRRREPDRKYRSDFGDVVSFPDHGYVYSTDHVLREKIGFLQKSSDYSEPKEWSGEASYHSLLAKFTAHGYALYAKDLTTPDIAEVGWRVVRAVAPDMTLLHGIHPYPFLGCKRLYRPAIVFSWAHDQESAPEPGSFPPHLLG
jgi:ribosomal protein S12 methylthiotransferase accessory factor